MRRSNGRRETVGRRRRKTQPRRNASKFHRRRDKEGRENGAFRGFARATSRLFFMSVARLQQATEISKILSPRRRTIRIRESC